MVPLRGVILLVVLSSVALEVAAGNSNVNSDEEISIRWPVSGSLDTDEDSISGDSSASELEDNASSSENSVSYSGDEGSEPKAKKPKRIAYDPVSGIEVYSNQVTWAQARKACRALNKDLISVENSTQIEYLRRLLPIELDSYSERYWIGGHTKLKNPGRGWYWVNSLRKMPWRPVVGAPPIPKDQTDEECAEVEYKHKPKERLRILYGDDDCSTPLAYICSVRQKPLEKQK